MPNNTKQEIERIIDAIEILSGDAFRFAGGMILQASAYASLDSVMAPHPLPNDLMVRAIQMTLYNQCYSHRFPGPPSPSPYAPDPNLTLRMDAANQSREGWDGGWRIYHSDPGGCIWVVKGDRQRNAMPGSYLEMDCTGAAPQTGAMVNLFLPRGSLTLQPGFQFFFSQTPTDIWDEFALTRVYFNSQPDSVAPLIEYLTKTLNAFQVPYRIKSLTDAAQYTRLDSTVLYFAGRYNDIAAKILRDLPSDVASNLTDSTPLFTFPFRPGIGLADDPGHGESFGMNRCRLVAEGVVDAYRTGSGARESRMADINNRFAMNNLNLDYPYRGAGRKGPYSFSAQENPTS